MIMYFLEFAVNANTSDILDFLEKENQFIRPDIYLAEKPKELNITVNYYGKREDDTFSIYTKIYTTKYKKDFPRCYEDAPEGQGNQVIKFEILRLTDTKSLVKGSYAADNTTIELMYLIRLKRLLLLFDSKFSDDLQVRLEELQKEEGEWGWVVSNNTIFGNKVRIYGKLPKQPEIDPSSQSSSNTNSTNSISTGKNMKNSTAVVGDNAVITNNYYNSEKKKISSQKTKKQKSVFYKNPLYIVAIIGFAGAVLSAVISKIPDELLLDKTSKDPVSVCENPYKPIIEGARWDYNIIGKVNDAFTQEVLSVNESGFVEEDVYVSGVTRRGIWNCDNGNLISLNPTGGGSANVSTTNSESKFKTTTTNGITLPAVINSGNNWSQSLILEGTQSINNETIPISNLITQDCSAEGIEPVSVPAGNFNAMKIVCQVTMNINVETQGSSTQTTVLINNTSWYALNVGLVKTISNDNSSISTIELTWYSIP